MLADQEKRAVSFNTRRDAVFQGRPVRPCARRHGRFNAYLTKPFTKDSLLRTVREYTAAAVSR
jgi:CheY-like chemotaxis protein